MFAKEATRVPGLRSRRGARRALLAVALLVVAQVPLITSVQHAQAAGYSATVLGDAPAVYYRLDEASGTTAADTSGNGVSGTYQAGVTHGVPGALQGDSDTAVSAAGGAPLVVAPDTSLPAGNTARTLEAWLKTAGSTGYLGILGYGTGANLHGVDISLLNNTGLFLNFGNGNTTVTLPYSLGDNRWHAVDVAFPGAGTAVVYVDGQVVATTPIPTLATTTGAGLDIGSGVGTWNGSLDEVAIYPTALSAAQIRAHWQSGVGASCLPLPTSGYAGIVAADSPSRYYRLGERSGRVMSDSSGNCRDGAYQYDALHVSGALSGDSDGAVGSSATAAPLAIASDDGLPTGNSARTVEAWIKTPGVGATTYEGIVQYGNVSQLHGFLLEISGTDVVTNFGNGNIHFSMPYNLVDNRWHELAAVLDGSGHMLLYVDGQVTNSILVNATLATTLGYGVVVGGGAAANFSGSIDEVAVYPAALTPAQLGNHWRVGVGGTCPGVPTTGYAGLVGSDGPSRYYRLGELGGRTALDYSGNCRDAAYNYDAPRVGGVTSDDGNGAIGSPSPAGSSVIGSDDGLPLGNSTRTAEVWFNTPGVTGQEALLSYGVISQFQGFEIDLSSTNLAVNFGNYNAVWSLSTSLFDSKWHQIAVTIDSTDHITAYIDAGAQATFQLQALATLGTSPLLIGAGSGGSAFVGTLDEVAVYPTALSAARISAHYNAVFPIGGGLSDAGERGGGSLCYTCLQRELHHAVRVQPIDTENGNMYHTFSDIDIPGRGYSLLMTRTYNSNAASTDSGMGYGWVFNDGATLSVNGSTATLNEENGAQTVFTLSNGAWTAPPRVIATLTHNADGTWELLRDNTQELHFDATGTLVAERDHLHGYQTSFSYSGGQLSAVTDEAGRSLSFAWAAGHLVSVTDPAGRQVRYQYNDGLGNLTDVYDVNNGHWVYGYDAAHHLTTMTDPAGNVVTTHYDSQGRADWQTDGMGRKTSFAYQGAKTTVTDPMGNVSIEYYSAGLRVAETRGVGTPQAATWHFAYDPNTVALTQVVDPNGNATSYTYDSQANLLTTTDPLNRTTTYTYNGFNEPLTITDPNNVTTTLTYDSGNGNLLSRSTPLVGSSPAQSRTTSYQYGDALHPGDVTAMVDPDGKTWQYGYDQYGDLVSSTDPLGDRTTLAYNNIGWLLTKTEPRENAAGCGCPGAYTTTYGYRDGQGNTDEYGDVQTVTDPLHHVTTTTYDADRNVKTVTDADGHPATVYTYDADNELTQTQRSEGTVVATSYNADGTVHQQIDGAQQATTYAYDPLARVVGVTDPLSRTTAYSYDGAGNLLTETDPQGHVTSYTYDPANQRVAVSYSDGVTPNVSNLTYDGDGRRTGMTDGTGSSSWTWDSLGRLIASADGAGKTVGYGYDLKGQLTSLTYPDQHVVTRSYDDAGRLTAISDWLGHTTTYTPDPDSNISTVAYPNQTTATMTYDPNDRLSSITDAAGATTLASFTYGRDNNGQVQSSSTTGVPAPSSDSYSYTSLNQVAQDNSLAFTYDHADNPTALGATVQAFEAANQLTQSSSISLVGTAKAATNDTTTSLSVSLPAGATAGDTVVVASTQPTGITASATGYTQQADASSGAAGGHTTVLTRQLTGGEQNVALAYSAPSARAVVVLVYRGALAVDVVGAGGGAVASTTVTAPGVTSTVAGDRLVLLQGANQTTGSTAWSAPSDMGEEVQQSSQALVSAGAADRVLTASGATGDKTTTLDQAADLDAVLLALKPNSTGFGFDARGNRTSATPVAGAATSFAYDQANRLTAVGSAATYAYNGDGLRVSKTVGGNTEHFVYDQAEGLPLPIVDGTTEFVYGPGGTPLEQVTPPSPQVSVVGSAHGGNPATTTSTTAGVALPTGIVAGDQIILGVTFPAGTGNSVSTPAGYTQVGNLTQAGTGPTSDVTAVFRKSAAGTEGGTVLQVQFSGTFASALVVGVYRGVDASNPLDFLQARSASNASSVSTDTATARYAGDEVVVLQGATYVGQAPQGWHIDGALSEENTAPGNATISAGIADGAVSSAGSVGPYVSTFGTPGPTTGQLTAIFLGLRRPNSVLYFHQDQLGSTRLLTDPAGAVAATFTYDAYGNLVGSSGSATTPLLYAGQYRDAESGLYYLRARYYDPATAQFLSRDPLSAKTGEPYGYVRGDPLNSVDPTGLDWWNPTTWGLCVRNPFGGNNDNGGCHTTLSTAQGAAGVVVGGAVACALVTAGICGSVGLTAPDVQDEVEDELPSVVGNASTTTVDDVAATEPSPGTCSRFLQTLREREGADGAISRIIKTQSDGQTMAIVHQVVDVTGEVIHEHYKFLRGQ